MPNWLLLHYRLPSEPSAARVYIWRKLKRLGALLHQDAVWVLPNTPREQEQFQWLAAEIAELGGEVTMWQARSVMGVTEDQLIRQFTRQVDQPYTEILQALQLPEADLEALSRQYQQVHSKDHFESELGQRVREALVDLRGGKP